MTKKQRLLILEYRKLGYGYKKISTLLGLSVSCVKSHCRRHPETQESVEGSNFNLCTQCGKVITSLPHHKKKMFCSDECRTKWWSKHQKDINHKKVYPTVCQNCGQTFISIRKDSKYCCRQCYMDFRKENKENE